MSFPKDNEQTISPVSFCFGVKSGSSMLCILPLIIKCQCQASGTLSTVKNNCHLNEGPSSTCPLGAATTAPVPSWYAKKRLTSYSIRLYSIRFLASQHFNTVDSLHQCRRPYPCMRTNLYKITTHSFVAQNGRRRLTPAVMYAFRVEGYPVLSAGHGIARTYASRKAMMN